MDSPLGHSIQFYEIVHEPFGLDICADKLLRVHAVVADEAQCGKRSSAENSHPRYSFRAEDIVQPKVDTDGYANGEDRKNELTQVQPEEYAFLIVPYSRLIFTSNSFSLQSNKAPDCSEALWFSF